MHDFYVLSGTFGKRNVQRKVLSAKSAKRIGQVQKKLKTFFSIIELL